MRILEKHMCTCACALCTVYLAHGISSTGDVLWGFCCLVLKHHKLGFHCPTNPNLLFKGRMVPCRRVCVSQSMIWANKKGGNKKKKTATNQQNGLYELEPTEDNSSYQGASVYLWPLLTSQSSLKLVAGACTWLVEVVSAEPGSLPTS
jgi:hypothetical protein